MIRPAPAEHAHVREGDRVFAAFTYYGEWYDTIQAYKQRGTPRPTDTDAAEASAAIGAALATTVTGAHDSLGWSGRTVCVPMAGSSAAGTDRVPRLAETAVAGLGIAVVRAVSIMPHLGFSRLGNAQRPGAHWIATRMTLDPIALDNAGGVIVIDDVLASGAHWRAVCDRIDRTGRACAGVFAAHDPQLVRRGA